jgi:hypothetical protein
MRAIEKTLGVRTGKRIIWLPPLARAIARPWPFLLASSDTGDPEILTRVAQYELA